MNRLPRPRRAAAALVLVFAGAFLAIEDVTPQAETSRTALLTELDGPVGPASADYVSRAIDAARKRNAALIVLRIDTPGGLDTSMRVIVQDILSAPVPIIGYVAPSGARAASAGTYILYATHVAAMAPGTDLGAATPVQIGVSSLCAMAGSRIAATASMASAVRQYRVFCRCCIV